MPMTLCYCRRRALACEHFGRYWDIRFYPLKSQLPLMFVMYINELAAILREAGVTVRFFADDLKMYARITNCADVTVLQNALDRLVHWADLWQLQISITKCNSMHIGRQQTFSVDLKIRDLSLPVVSSCRDLGILVCNNLSHSSHIANIINATS